MIDAVRRLYDMVVVHDSCPNRYCGPLFIGCACGLFGILPDFDHIILVWGSSYHRQAHTPLLILSLIVGGVCLTCIGRLLAGLVLNKKIEK